MNQSKFIEELSKINISLNSNQIEQLNKYYELLIEWNEKINLTNITEKEQVYLKHFYDSLTLIKSVDLKENLTLCDIGTGAGFPGIVLKIVFPNLKITLVDSLNKRVKFLQEVIKELNLTNIEVYHERAEIFARQHIESFDVVTARAVAHLSILLEYCIPMVKINKYFIAMKANINEELEESQNAIEKLKAKVVKIDSFKLPVEESNRTIIKIEKLEKTNKKYPRNTNEIKRNRL